MLKLAAAGLGLFTLLTSAMPQGDGKPVAPLEPQPPAQAQPPPTVPVSCPFNSTLGPNILVAVVELPSKATEIDAWIYGLNWCSHSNKVSSGDHICFPKTPARTVEFMHVPLSDKFGSFDDGCYANVDIRFENCSYDAAGKPDWRTTTAKITSKDGKSEYTYQCMDDREYHGCVYNGQLSPPNEVKYTAFMSCGITAEP